MVFLFRDRSVTSIFFIIILSIAVHLHFFVAAPIVIASPSEGLIAQFLINYIKPLPSTVLIVLYQLVLIIQAIRLNTCLNSYKMYNQTGYTTAMAYILFSSLFAQWANITPALVANFLIIWIFVLLCKLYSHPSPKNLIFNIGLVCGVTILCYHPTIILITIAIFALAVVRPFRITEWLIMLMGLLMPFYFLIAGLYLTNNIGLINDYIPDIHLHLPLQKANPSVWIALALLSLTLLFGLYYWQQNLARMVIQVRKNWGVIIILLLLMLPIPFVFKDANIEAAVLSIVPLAAFAANGFLYPKKLLLPNIIFWLFVGLIVYNNWAFIKN